MTRTVSGKSPLSYVGIKEKQPPENYFINRTPTTSDTSFDEGDIWIDRTNEKAYILVKIVGAVATWSEIGTSGDPLNSLTSDSGIATPVANTITCTGNNGLQTIGSAGSLTYQFSPVSAGYSGSQREYAQTGITTSDATVTQIASIDLDTNTMVSVLATFRGFKDDYSANCSAYLKYAARRVAGGALETSAPIVDLQKDTGGAVSADADVSGNAVRLLVTGIAAENWVWTCTYEYAFVKTAL